MTALLCLCVSSLTIIIIIIIIAIPFVMRLVSSLSFH